MHYCAITAFALILRRVEEEMGMGVRELGILMAITFELVDIETS